MNRKVSELSNNQYYIRYNSALEDFDIYRKHSIPLCAAENIISEFSKKPLSYGLQERYILGGYLDYKEEENMIGSKKLLPFYEIISEQCKDLFGAVYTDCRSLSGMNALQNILLSLVNKDETMLILSPESGGHAAIPNILDKLHINYIELPYDYINLDIDYEKTNKVLKDKRVDYILFAPTDIIFLPDFKKMSIPNNTTLIYDASQVLAYYINNKEHNPLYLNYRVIMMGGTHKTIPGVAKALIMTNNKTIAEDIDKTINPLYLRNTHIQNVASLILTLIEMENFSKEYCIQMSQNSNFLGKRLSELGLDIINRQGVYSETHQLFVHMDKEIGERFYSVANKFGISLNKKNKRLFDGFGIRLGVQEITRYGWAEQEMLVVSEILSLIYKNNLPKIDNLIESLKYKKDINYTFVEE